jgi:hypothetical protein
VQLYSVVNVLSRSDLVRIARSVAREVNIVGELQISETTYDNAPFGEFAHSEVHLSSTEQESCPIIVSLFEEEGADGYVTVSFGGSYHEIWFLPPDKTLSIVKNFFIALMKGNYEEWRQSRTKNDSVYGLLKDDHGNVLYSDFGRRSPDELIRRGYRHKDFRPY